ncbi:hypothetical protein FQA47_015236 [Oryzias melastigma]|uniref:Uncharacterized protein n=1 Tax=Oryzias melastigma TaxID=30732 RepID=A0A834CD70_ORYME|nr:hypothetical protein FQA47_015236 [Oryzias melastigma]
MQQATFPSHWSTDRSYTNDTSGAVRIKAGTRRRRRSERRSEKRKLVNDRCACETYHVWKFLSNS